MVHWHHWWFSSMKNVLDVLELFDTRRKLQPRRPILFFFNSFNCGSNNRPSQAQSSFSNANAYASDRQLNPITKNPSVQLFFFPSSSTLLISISSTTTNGAHKIARDKEQGLSFFFCLISSLFFQYPSLFSVTLATLPDCAVMISETSTDIDG